MKTILSLTIITATAALIGLLPLALAESKPTKGTKAPAETKAMKSAAETKAMKSPSETMALKSAGETKSLKSPTETKALKSAAKKAAPKSSENATPAAVKSPLTPAQEDKLLTLLNEGSSEEIASIPGIAGTRADSIIQSRPFASIHEIILVDGVGNATFEKILSHGKTLTKASGQTATKATTTVENESKPEAVKS